MRNKIFTLSTVLLFFLANIFAQEIETYVLDDFENGEVNFTDEVNVNPPAHFDFAVVDNPFKTGINTSNKVWEWKRYDAEEENEIWAGFYSTLKEEIPEGYNRVEIKYLRTNATSQLKIKCEGIITKEIASEEPATKTNEWETLVFNLTENGVKNVITFGFFPDFYEPIDPAATVYIDDIVFIKDESVIVEPPTSYVLFHDSANDRFYDQSWVNQTPPSTVVAEHWQDTGLPDGDKLPVITSPVKDGNNALQLQWKSVPSGDWMALVAAIDWQSFDLESMLQLRFWVNSPAFIDKTLLPHMFLEAHSGDPNKTGEVAMADYLPEGVPANTWTEVVVPLEDLWASNTEFQAMDVIKGIFFSQNVTDNVEHTLFLDEFTFVSSVTGIDNTTISRNDVTASYVNGQILVANYSGIIRILDITGKQLVEADTYDGVLNYPLKTGVFIVNTTKGNTKIIVR